MANLDEKIAIAPVTKSRMNQYILYITKPNDTILLSKGEMKNRTNLKRLDSFGTFLEADDCAENLRDSEYGQQGIDIVYDIRTLDDIISSKEYKRFSIEEIAEFFKFYDSVTNIGMSRQQVIDYHKKHIVQENAVNIGLRVMDYDEFLTGRI